MEGGESSKALSELREDLKYSNRFRLRFGGFLVAVSGAMTLAGWQAIGLFGIPSGILVGALPTAALGAGFCFLELSRARRKRRRFELEDQTEEARIRSALAVDGRLEKGDVGPRRGDT